MGDICFFFQAEDGIRDLVRSRGLGDVYKRQICILAQIILVITKNLDSNILDKAIIPGVRNRESINAGYEL